MREESFAHRGKHYTIPPEVPYRGYTLKEISLVPRPLRQPVEVWQPIVSGGARGLEFMARHGIKGIISATAEELVQRWVRDYQEAGRRHGRERRLGEDLILGFRMCLDDTVEGAIRRARPYFEEHAKVMAPLGMLRYSEEHAKAVVERRPQSPTTASLEDGVRNRSWLCGPAGDIIGYLKALEEKYPGLDHVMLGWPIGVPRAMMVEQLERFARGRHARVQALARRLSSRRTPASAGSPRTRSRRPTSGPRAGSGARPDRVPRPAPPRSAAPRGGTRSRRARPRADGCGI